MDEEKLIHLVQTNDLLYNKSSVHYKTAWKKKEVWANISKELGVNASFCERRWLSLRERLTKELRKLSSSGSGSVERSTWAHFDSMQFLCGHLLKRQKRTNFSTSEEVRLQVPSPSSSFDITADLYISQELSTCSSFKAEPLSPGVVYITDPLSTYSLDEKEITPQTTVAAPPIKRKKRLNMDENMVDASTKPQLPSAPIDEVAENIGNVVKTSLAAMGNKKKFATVVKIMQVLNEAAMEADY